MTGCRPVASKRQEASMPPDATFSYSPRRLIVRIAQIAGTHEKKVTSLYQFGTSVSGGATITNAKFAKIASIKASAA